MFGMLNSLFAWGLLAVGLPVVIHFLTRPRPRTIRYPTFRLLVEAGHGRQALHRLRTLLVLLLRVLAVAAIVLAFCRLYRTDARHAAKPGEIRRAVIIVDASLSMSASADGIPLFTRARAQAADLLRGMEPGSSVGIVFAGARPRPVLPALSNNHAVLHEGLSKGKASQEVCDADAALALAARLLDGKGAVYVFSDFQRSNWGAADFARFGDCAFFLRPIATTDVENLGVTAIAKSPDEPIENETFEITATLFNATADKQVRSVRLELEGIGQMQDAELKPFSSAPATFSLSLPRAGSYSGKVRIDGDALPEDNTRYFSVRVRKSLHALLISDSNRNDPRSAAFLAETALAPGKQYGLSVTRRLSQDVDQASLEMADIFVLVSPVQMIGRNAEVIARRVGDGAHLALFLDASETVGTSERVRALLDALAGASEGAIRPPFAVSSAMARADGEGEALGTIKSHAGPLRIFHSTDQGDLATLRFNRHLLTRNLSDRADEILAQYEDGTCALALAPAGRGMALYVNMPVTPGGSNLAGSPLFPALLHECLRELRRGSGEVEAMPGLDWSLTVENLQDAETALRVLSPDGETLDTQTLSRGRVLKLSMPAVADAGIYPVEQSGRVVEYGIVNLHPRETDTRRVPLEDLVDEEDAAQARVVVLDAEGDVLQAGRARPLWPMLLALGALLLAGEMLVLTFWRKRPGRRA